jgi:hypothetical protein
MPGVDLPNPQDIETQRRERFTRRVALTTAIYAVSLALASLGGGNVMKDMLLAQQLASNQWAYYQAKVVREDLARHQKAQLDLTLLEREKSVAPATRQALEGARQKASDEAAHFKGQRLKIQTEARKFEADRDLSQQKDPYFDFAQVALQLAIILASIAMLASARPVFYVSLIFAAFGALFTLNGFTLLFRIPFFH